MSNKVCAKRWHSRYTGILWLKIVSYRSKNKKITIFRNHQPNKEIQKKNLTRFASSDVTVSQPRRKGFTKCLHKLNFQSLIAWSALIIISLFSISLSFHFYLVSFDQLLQPVEKSLHVYQYYFKIFYRCEEIYIVGYRYCEYKYIMDWIISECFQYFISHCNQIVFYQFFFFHRQRFCIRLIF